MATPPQLPDPADEDALVAHWLDHGDEDPDALAELVQAALDAKRMRLAARLVQALPEDADDPDLERARQAARLMLVRKTQPEDHSWSALDDAWREHRRVRIARMRRRQRQRVRGDDARIGRLDPRRRGGRGRR